MRRLTLALLLSAAAWPAAAQTIEDALSAAYGSNADLQAARAELRAVDETVPQAIAGWLPRISGDAEAGYQGVRTETGLGETSSHNRPYGFGVSLEQPIFAGGSNFANLSRADNLVLAQRAALQNTEQTVLLTAATAFVDVARDQSVVRLRTNNVEVLERQLQATRDRFTVGEDTRTDVAQAEARVATARAELVAAEGQLQSSIATYVEVIGAQPGEVQPPPPLGGLPQNLGEAVSAAREGNPAVRRALFDQRAAEDAVDSEFGALLPQVSVTGSYGRDYSGGTFDEQETTRVEGRVTIPFFTGGSNYSQVRQSKQTAAQRRLELTAAERAATQQATAAWESLRSAEAQISSFEASIEATAIALDGVRQEAQVGSRTVLDVLNAEQEALDAQVNLVGALRDRVVASYELLSAVGRLNAQALALPVTLYDPTENADSVRFQLLGTGINE